MSDSQKKNIKFKKNVIIINLIIFLIFFIIMLTLIINSKTKKIMEQNGINVKDEIDKELGEKKLNSYKFSDLRKMIAEEQLSNQYEIRIESEEFLYEDNLNIDVHIENIIEQSNYKLEIILNGENLGKKNIYSSNEKVNLRLKKERENEISVNLYKDDNLVKNNSKKIYYIKKYKNQFNDQNEYTGVNLHIADLSEEDLKKCIMHLKAMGINMVRVDIKTEKVIKKGNIVFDDYDDKLNLLNANGIEIIGILDTNFCDNKTALKENEIRTFIDYSIKVSKQYPYIEYFEICNEPNYYYKTEDEIKTYSNIVNDVKKALPNKKILAGSLIQDGEYSNNTKEFYNIITNNNSYYYSDFYSYHLYDLKPDNNNYEKYIKKNEDLRNNIGGFIKYFISETGLPSIERIGEELQAQTLIQQICIRLNNNIKHSIIYNFRNTGTDNVNYEQNYGLVNNNYIPKQSFYAIRNYNENTNGAEYIGKVNLAEGIEAHVYDKDGNARIIAWSNDPSKTIEIYNKNFIVSDLYGNLIENEKENLTISYSPIYLDNVGTQYFYQAISNMAIEGYNNFENKFEKKIKEIPNLSVNIQEIKEEITKIEKISMLDEKTAIQLMKKHYQLGDMIIQAYEDKKVNISYVELSSMLDFLNNIGNSYEDLVTVSTNEKNCDMNGTNEKINNIEKKIDDNNYLKFIYAKKILEFSKDYYQKAEYINHLEEENTIKTGLIMSKNLHAQLLANWANEFVGIYIDEYITQNPPTLTYSTITLTNKNVTATLTANYDIQITNNNNSPTYTFTQNGSFTFKYTVNNKPYQVTATVTNIDKIAPKIEGVEDGQTYYIEQQIIPKITDINLKEVTLQINGVQIDYEIGEPLIVEGIYKLTATDEAGNTKTIQFQVMEKPEEKYIMQENSIQNIKYNTTKTKFDAKIKLQETYAIERKTNNETIQLKSTDTIASGDILTTASGKKYTLIVAGDITKDGQVDIQDFVRMRKYLLGLRELDEVETLAADANVDSKDLSISDYIRIRIFILNQLAEN